MPIIRSITFKTVITGICLLMASGRLLSQVMWQVSSSGSKAWYLNTGDEFNARRLDSTIWKYGYPWGSYVYELDMLYTPDNVVCSEGVLTLVTKKHPAFPVPKEYIDEAFLKQKNKFPDEKGQYTCLYSGGAISSIRKYKYGYFEMRFKANAEKGLWPAFWLYGGEPNEEIDFYEGKGEKPDQVHLDVHCPDGCDNYKGGFLNLQKNWGGWIKTDQSLTDNWNIISGEWQEDYIKFFLNGTAIAYFKGTFKTAQYLMINCAVAKNEGAFHPGPDSLTRFPNDFQVDYIRVWDSQKKNEITSQDTAFKHTPETIHQDVLYGARLKKKVRLIYDQKTLEQESGFISLLPLSSRKYSISILGEKINTLQIAVADPSGKEVSSFIIQGKQYEVLDLGSIAAGRYQFRIMALGQIFTHDIVLE